jgi:hypothetical protein
LPPEASASLRDRLLEGIEASVDDEALDAWALRAWAKANTLAPEHGEQVRQAFAARLAQLRRPDQNVLEESTHQPAKTNGKANHHMRIIAATPSPCPRSGGTATSSTYASLPSSPASSVADSLATRTTFGLPRRADSA